MQMRPGPDDYSSYFERYIDLVPDGDICRTLATQAESSLAFLGTLHERAGFRYQPEKWSLKQVVGHLSDTERILSYRALRFARADEVPLSGFEQDDYVRQGGFHSQSWDHLISGFRCVRESTLALFKGLDPKAFLRAGVADGNRVTVLALAFIIAGHELHHIRIIRRHYLEV